MKYSKNKDYKVIAVVMASFSSEDQKALIKRITEMCEGHHCRVVFFSTLSNFYVEEQGVLTEQSLFDIIAVECYDAILLMAETFKVEAPQKRLVERATVAGVPVIAVDHHLDGCINISFDYKDAFRQVVKHMVEYHEYRTINFFGGEPDNSFSDERLNVFKEVLAENGIPFEEDRVYYGYFWEDPTVLAVEKMLQDRPGLPDAIICANDTMALTVCDCLQKKGYRIPQDVAVSGFDGIDAERFHFPRLLTSLYDIDCFLEAVFAIVNDDNLVAGEREVKVDAYKKMQIGGSCGCKGMPDNNAAAEIIRLRSNMHELMDYQINLGQMVAKYGNRSEKEIIRDAIPYQLRNMFYHEAWFQNGPGLVHYKQTDDSVEIGVAAKFPIEDIIPGLSEQLDSGRPLLVTPVPAKEDPMGYAVVSFDSEKFWYAAYSSFIFHLRFLIEMMRTQNELVRLYRMDSLTGLLNRNGFYARMDQLFEDSKVKRLTVISLDMYQFKQINDTYGHAEGDIALKTVGEIIRESTSRREVTTRNGGDEFLIVLHEEDQEQRAQEIVTAIKEKAEAFNKTNTKDYKLIFSIGVCTEDAETHSLDDFLKEADERMYAHKNRQRKNEGES